MKKKPIIARVYRNESNGQKLVTIPKKNRAIKKGDFVKIELLKVEDIL